MSIKILTDNVLTSFADLISANKRRLYRLWLIAPWISSSGFGLDPVVRIADTLRDTHCRLVLITRPPAYTWHEKAIKILSCHPHREFFGCGTLHTKLYILECDGFRGAVFGSPNLTPAADEDNRELAIEFRTTVEGRGEPTAALISELLSYASFLRNQNDVQPLE
jgi:phosphatidylserine/phosphatidylglycerophosphate/cardiolipin synthase-like enzyme